MDEIVVRGMAKWPSVPAVYGWLSLDLRGHWLIKGERIGNPLVVEFIGRNYASDERGCWYFQNGPQRVFVDLEYTPQIYRVPSTGGEPLALATHGGRPVGEVRGAWLDENGALLLDSEHGVGIVHDRDLEQLAVDLVDARGRRIDEDRLEELVALVQQGRPADVRLRFRDGFIPIGSVASRDVPRRFGFAPRPEAPAGEEVCR